MAPAGRQRGGAQPAESQRRVAEDQPRPLRRIPQRRLGAARELDGPLLLLASDAGSYLTASTVVVDGGLTAIL